MKVNFNSHMRKSCRQCFSLPVSNDIAIFGRITNIITYDEKTKIKGNIFSESLILSEFKI